MMSVAWEASDVDYPSKAESPSRLQSLSTVSGSTRSGSPAESARSDQSRFDQLPEPFEVSQDASPRAVALIATLALLAIVPTDAQLGQRFADAVNISKDNLTGRQMVMRMIRMLRLCDYESDVILTVLATALVHLERIFSRTDTRMEDAERVSIAVLQCFNAHCYIMDEACPMKYWQQNIYTSYCGVKVLNSASYKLLKILKYNLSVTAEEVEVQKNYLLDEAPPQRSPQEEGEN